MLAGSCRGPGLPPAQVRLQVGLYAVYLLDWLAVFHREQLLVLRLEDHASDVKSTMRRVFQFLSLGMEVKGRWQG